MKRFLSLFLCMILIVTTIAACKQKPQYVNQPDGNMVETSETYDGTDMSFGVPIGWKVEEIDGSAAVYKDAKDDQAPFICFNVTEKTEAFLDYPNQDITFNSSQYPGYSILENRVTELNNRQVHVLRYKAQTYDSKGTVIYIKMYTFNDHERTYSIGLTSPTETDGIDEFYTIYMTFSGKTAVPTTAPEKTEPTTAIEYDFVGGDFNTNYPDGWKSDPTGRNPRVEPMQHWLSKKHNAVPVFVAPDEVEGFYPYISVLVGKEDEALLKQDDSAFDLSAYFKEYEQGEITRGKKNGVDTVTLNYSALNDDGKRIYIKQVLFNDKDGLYILSLFTSSTEFGYKEFDEMYDSFVAK